MSRASIGVFSVLPVLALLALPALAGDGQTPIPFTDPYVSPQTIRTPGSYVVTRNLAPAALAGPIIRIDCTAPTFTPPAAAVVIDLNGFTLDQTVDATIPVIEVIPTPSCEVLIRNGEVLGGSAGIAVPAGSRMVRIEDVQIKDPSGEGIFLFDPEKFLIRRNVIIGAGGPGIVVAGGIPSKSGTIEDNIVQQCGDMGIRVELASSVEISNNRVDEIFGVAGPPFGVGILLSDTQACLLTQNTIEEIFGTGVPNSGQGIRLENSTCKLYNNVIADVDGDGIYLDLGTDDCLVLDNAVSDAGRDGIYVEGSQNHIDRNVFNSNGFVFGGFGMHFLPGSFSNRSGRNSAVGNAGAVCVFPTVGGFPDYCDDTAPPGAINVSFGDNLVPVLF
jgi:parallel beta-helix repeat protein